MTESANTKTQQALGNAEEVISPLRRALRYLLRNLGMRRGDDGSLQENLRDLIEQHEEEQGGLDKEARLLLENLLTFGDLKVRDVMIPRADIVAVDITQSLDQIVRVFQEETHSRMPVYHNTLDDVLGMLHIKDMLAYWNDHARFNLRSVLREVLFAPPSMPVADLLLKMRTLRIHMALVADEYGGTDGLVTIEDLVESIVGDIEDEHDDDEVPLIRSLSDGALDVDGRVAVDDVEKSLNVDFLPEHRDEEIETIAGVVASLAGRVPQRGEIIRHEGGFELEITQADPRRVKRLLIRKSKSDSEGVGGSSVDQK